MLYIEKITSLIKRESGYCSLHEFLTPIAEDIGFVEMRLREVRNISVAQSKLFLKIFFNEEDTVNGERFVDNIYQCRDMIYALDIKEQLIFCLCWMCEFFFHDKKTDKATVDLVKQAASAAWHHIEWFDQYPPNSVIEEAYLAYIGYLDEMVKE